MYYKRYDNAEKILYANLNSFIEKKIFDNKRIYMFGTSRIASMIVTFLAEHGVKIDGFLDNAASRQGYKILDLQIYSPDILKDYSADNMVLIASSYQEEMIVQLINMGYEMNKNIVKVIDLPELMNDYSFVDRTGYVEMPMKEIKKCMVGIMKFLKKICEGNNIDYYLIGGTLLGAVRHQGFIPWDDDVDIYVKGKDMKRLSQLINQSDRYQLITCDTCEDFADTVAIMVDCNSIADINQFPLQATTGVWIDIIPVYGLPKGEDALKKYASTLKRLDMRRWGSLFDKNKLQTAKKELQVYMESFDIDQADYVGFWLSIFFTKERFPAEWFRQKEFLNFEGEKFRVPGQYKKLLQILYGDYMKMPPVEKRGTRHYFKAYYLKSSDAR